MTTIANGQKHTRVDTSTHFRTTRIDGVEIFYREAGPPQGPTVLLLHGFPSSSHMFRNLIPALADTYHVIAPDYPGFGHSGTPDHKDFAYTSEHASEIVGQLMDQLACSRYAMYVMDFGAPIGYRLALRHPDRVTAVVVQNGPAYLEGLGAFWEPFAAYWQDGSKKNRDALRPMLTLQATKQQYTAGSSDLSRIDPDNWLVDQALLDRPGVDEIMLDYFYDIRNSAAQYPAFQKFFKDRQPPTLIVSGANDAIFPEENMRAYLKDVPNAELHLLDSGHFALEDKGREIAELTHEFLDRTVLQS